MKLHIWGFFQKTAYFAVQTRISSSHSVQIFFNIKRCRKKAKKKKKLTKDCKVIRVSSNGLAKDNFSFSGKPYGVQLNDLLVERLLRKLHESQNLFPQLFATILRKIVLPMRTKNHVYDNYSLESLWTGVFVSVIHPCCQVTVAQLNEKWKNPTAICLMLHYNLNSLIINAGKSQQMTTIWSGG